MATNNTHMHFIECANEMGYFPTAKQAKEISSRSAEEYAAIFNGDPPKGRVREAVFEVATERAIVNVMENRKPDVFVGFADAALIESVNAALLRLNGKTVRVRIDQT